MIEIKTYINPPNKPIYNLQKATTHPPQFFINVEDGSRMMDVLKQLDLNYLNGVIVINYNNKVINEFQSLGFS